MLDRFACTEWEGPVEPHQARIGIVRSGLLFALRQRLVAEIGCIHERTSSIRKEGMVTAREFEGSASPAKAAAASADGGDSCLSVAADDPKAGSGAPVHPRAAARQHQESVDLACDRL